jgi:hypothetical protein
MEKRREKHSGLQHRGPYMGFNHPKAAISSLTRAVTGNCQRLQNKPREGLRLQGKVPNIYSAGFWVLASRKIFQRTHFPLLVTCSEIKPGGIFCLLR